MSSQRKPTIVLLAEDSDDDAFFFRWTLQKTGLPCQLVHAANGLEALRLLEASRSPDGSRNENCPELVFLDLKMPTLSGFEVLEWIQAHPFTPPLTVVVLSGSEHATDIARARELGASDYCVKPIAKDILASHLSAAIARAALPGEKAASAATASRGAAP